MIPSKELVQQFLEPPFLLSPLIRRGDYVLIHGASGIGKSRFSLALAAALVRAGEPVIYVDTETPLSLLGQRLREIHHPDLWFILTPTSVESLMLEDLPAAFVNGFTIVVDNFSSNNPQVEQVNQAAVACVMRPWGELVRAGFITVIYLHHENRSGALFGSAEFTRAPSGVWSLKEERLLVEKSRHASPQRGQLFGWNATPFLELWEYSESAAAIKKRRQRMK